MKVFKHTTVENVKAPTWDMIKDQIDEGLEKIAIDRRAAIELGVPTKDIDEYIAKCGETTFRKFENMSNIQMHGYLLAKIISEVDDPEMLKEILEGSEEDA